MARSEKSKAHKAAWRKRPEVRERDRLRAKHAYETDAGFRKKARERYVKRHYGISGEDFAAMLAEQEGMCAACLVPFTASRGVTSMCVDHSHATGEVRGLLCRGCNSAIGFAKEDPVRLRGCADYLEAVNGH